MVFDPREACGKANSVGFKHAESGVTRWKEETQKGRDHHIRPVRRGNEAYAVGIVVTVGSEPIRHRFTLPTTARRAQNALYGWTYSLTAAATVKGVAITSSAESRP